METVVELKARDTELKREWLWLIDALNTVARARADNGTRTPWRVESHISTLHSPGRFYSRNRFTSACSTIINSFAAARHCRRLDGSSVNAEICSSNVVTLAL